jgi:hypothetical protein
MKILLVLTHVKVHESAEMAKVLSDCKAELKDALGDSARAEAANNSAKKK